jgi:hypothetical protein
MKMFRCVIIRQVMWMSWSEKENYISEKISEKIANLGEGSCVTFKEGAFGEIKFGNC